MAGTPQFMSCPELRIRPVDLVRTNSGSTLEERSSLHQGAGELIDSQCAGRS